MRWTEQTYIGFVSSFVVSIISPLSVYVHLQHIQLQIKREVSEVDLFCNDTYYLYYALCII